MEKRLSRQPEIAKEYTRIIGQQIEKGYVSKLLLLEDSQTVKWYLPHFPVARKDSSTTKVWIVFDESTKYDDIALNDVINQGPKLQNNLFDVLLHFRRYPVALACDIAEMYLSVELDPKDRACYRPFLMERYERGTDTRRIPVQSSSIWNKLIAIFSTVFISVPH